MRVTLCGEPGAPVVCPGREYGSHVADEDFPEDQLLSRASKTLRPIVSEKDQILHWSECEPNRVTKLETSRIKTWLNEPECGNKPYIPPHPQEVLQHMLQKVQEMHSDRYGDYLKSHSQDEIMTLMVALLQPKAWQVLCSKEYTHENLLTIGCEPGRRGIYLHVLWHKKQPSRRFYLYVGQSVQLLERLADHRDPKYRAKHQSLHYYVWDLGMLDKELEIEEKFVFLSLMEDDVDSLLLNLMEMWCSLMLQTLTRNALQAYLPEGTLSPCAGEHLNIALPLHQSIQGEIIRDRLCLDIYHSHDPAIRAYYASLRQNFYNLKFSSSPLVREIYNQKMLVAQFIRAKTCRQKSAQALIAGREVIIKRNQWRQRFSISHWNISISRKSVHLDDGATLHLECDLLSGRHPNCYAMTSQAYDPAARLGIRLIGVDTYNEPVDIWLRTRGPCEVFKMNTFVDMLEGRNIHDPQDRQRRWIP